MFRAYCEVQQKTQTSAFQCDIHGYLFNFLPFYHNVVLILLLYNETKHSWSLLMLCLVQVLTKEEFVHLPPGEVDTQQDADLDNDYIKE